ncbi:hypothetical protein N7G274_002808 [Stereocaulon virgatum]|uniref:Uncharacterized protein n=1 Tax=Stereocaulon virgatum TaxID=373712 RepID=A0ABR4AIW2_9LECA
MKHGSTRTPDYDENADLAQPRMELWRMDTIRHPYNPLDLHANYHPEGSHFRSCLYIPYKTPNPQATLEVSASSAAFQSMIWGVGNTSEKMIKYLALPEQI